MDVHLEDAYEVVRVPHAEPLAFFSCEHASERLPEPWEWPAADRWLVGTHWAYDIGAADLTYQLVRDLGGTAVLARFSRLLIDPNRPESSPTLFRDVADGHPVELNRRIEEPERALRLSRLWQPYHRAVDLELARSPAPVLIAVHTFTPVYEGEPRELELGVLFDHDEELGTSLHRALLEVGVHSALNEPYSGKGGFIYAADRHARAHNRRTIEIEVRQDLAVEEVFRNKLVQVLGVWLRSVSELIAR